MSSFVLTNYDLRSASIFCYRLKKIAAKSYQMLVKDYNKFALGKLQCFEWCKKLKIGNFEKQKTWKIIENVLMQRIATIAE